LDGAADRFVVDTSWATAARGKRTAAGRCRSASPSSATATGAAPRARRAPAGAHRALRRDRVGFAMDGFNALAVASKAAVA